MFVGDQEAFRRAIVDTLLTDFSESLPDAAALSLRNDTAFVRLTTGKTGNPDSDAILPSAMIAAYIGTAIPDGWAECDGLGGRPDLRGRFLRGRSNSSPAADTGGSTSHTHSMELSASGTTGENWRGQPSVPLGSGGRLRDYSVDSHSHPVDIIIDGTTSREAGIPPYTSVIFLCKL